MKNKILLVIVAVLFIAQIFLFYAMTINPVWLAEILPFLKDKDTFELVKIINMLLIVPLMIWCGFLIDSVRTGSRLANILAAVLVQALGVRQINDRKKLKEFRGNMWVVTVIFWLVFCVIVVVTYSDIRDRVCFSREASAMAVAKLFHIDGRWNYYKFTADVDGREYRGRFVDVKYKAKVGNIISVIYNLANPGKNETLRSIERRKLREPRSWLYGLFLAGFGLVCLVIGFVCYSKARRYGWQLSRLKPCDFNTGQDGVDCGGDG